jgi:hypothetical protein
MNILWPSFLAAIMAEGCFFSLFEPYELLDALGAHEAPAIACYTIGFFFFWMIGMVAGTLTYYLNKVPSDSNQPF